MIRLLLCLAFFCFFITGAKAERACRQMWCAEGFEVGLGNNKWPSGKYSFEINADGEKTVCKSALPFTSCTGQTVCDSDSGVTIGESGCALPSSAQSFHSIMLKDIPEYISFSITHENGEVFSFESAISKNCSYPNGKGCDPKQCCSARLDVDVLWSGGQ